MLTVYLSLLEDEDDKRKLGEIYNRLRHPMYRVALRLLGQEELAQDAVQESFFKIIKHFSKISVLPWGEMAPYIVTITENTAKDMLRQAERRHTRPLEEVVWEPPAPEQTESLHAYDRLVSLILDLPESDREVLYLACVEEESRRNIAKALKLTEKQVEYRLKRGRKLLQTRILEEGYVP